MANGFRVVVHRNSESLHLRLEGDFDEAAARQVVWMISLNGSGAGRVFIHTNALGKISPIGQEFFQRNFQVFNGDHVRFIFTGDKALQIAPRGQRILA